MSYWFMLLYVNIYYQVLDKKCIIQRHWSHNQQLTMDSGYRDPLTGDPFSGGFSAGHSELNEDILIMQITTLLTSLSS